MNLKDICPAPCLPSARTFNIPGPGATADDLCFGNDSGRHYYAILLNNHVPQERGKLNPKVAIVGLSPGSNQIEAFVQAYRQTTNYGEASIQGAFSGLSHDIIAMIRGLGLADKLGIEFPKRNLGRHPDVYVTSLVACASLACNGSSNAFDLTKHPAASRCASNRFVDEMLNPNFASIRAVLLLGKDAEKAVGQLRTASGKTVKASLEDSGKLVLSLPHPSGQNKELVDLASYDNNSFPSLAEYVETRWSEYRSKPPRKGREKQTEQFYKARRIIYWQSISNLRRSIDMLEATA